MPIPFSCQSPMADDFLCHQALDVGDDGDPQERSFRLVMSTERNSASTPTVRVAPSGRGESFQATFTIDAKSQLILYVVD